MPWHSQVEVSLAFHSPHQSVALTIGKGGGYRRHPDRGPKTPSTEEKNLHEMQAAFTS